MLSFIIIVAVLCCVISTEHYHKEYEENDNHNLTPRAAPVSIIDLCTFDDNNCGYRFSTSYSEDKAEWEWKSTSSKSTHFQQKPLLDHTLGTSFGGYAFFGSTNKTKIQSITGRYLYSPLYAKPLQKSNILQFFYYVSANVTDWTSWIRDEPTMDFKFVASIVRRYNNDSTWSPINVWVKKKTFVLRQWNQLKLKAQIKSTFHIDFGVYITSKNEVVMAIDDVQFLPEEDHEAGVCTFRTCSNDGLCHEAVSGEAVCRCQPNYTGKNCESEKCSLISCKNGGHCLVQCGVPICNCTKDYTGDKCEIDKCSNFACENNGKCIVKDSDPICICTERYTGDKCNIDKCSLLACENNGICTIKNGNAFCNCTPNFTGYKCNIDKCSLLACENNGICTMKNGKPFCNCTPSFTGYKCDIDKCSLLACENNGKCIVKNGHAHCNCTPRFTGYKCNIDKCSQLACKNNGICVMENGYALCKCTPNFTGYKCEVDKCSYLACENNGSCTVENGNTICTCTPNFTGNKCNIDKCSLVSCDHGGICKIKNGKATCNNEYTENLGKKSYLLTTISGSMFAASIILILIVLVLFFNFFRKYQRNKNSINSNNKRPTGATPNENIEDQRSENQYVERKTFPKDGSHKFANPQLPRVNKMSKNTTTYKGRLSTANDINEEKENIYSNCEESRERPLTRQQEVASVQSKMQYFNNAYRMEE